MNKVIAIVGPTGVGKTKLSIALAKILDGEIINADSTQVYKGLDIATAKVTDEEKEGVVHHLLDIKEITDDYSVYDYQKDSRSLIEDILKKGKTPILVGGTGLYIKACLYNYEFNSKVVINNYDNLTNEELYNKLILVDPNTEIHMNNRKRVIRALNYYDTNNKPFSSKEKTDQLLYDTIFIGLTTNRDLLYEIINKRVDKMVQIGLIDEAFKIYESNIRTKAVMTPIGYKELFEYFDNSKTLDECIFDIKQRSRKYAKRQYTWFNNQMQIDWIEVNFDNFDITIKKALELIEKKK
jgi:tRNA dimethylallyltransferase